MQDFLKKYVVFILLLLFLGCAASYNIDRCPICGHHSIGNSKTYPKKYFDDKHWWILEYGDIRCGGAR